jgi:hypothetical protein
VLLHEVSKRSSLVGGFAFDRLVDFRLGQGTSLQAGQNCGFHVQHSNFISAGAKRKLFGNQIEV